MQTAQSRAAQWITGCFRTTPVGAMEILAGLVPIHAQIDRYMEKACLRTCTLHEGYPTRAILPPYWLTNQHNITAPFPLRSRPGARRQVVTPITHIDWIGRQSSEEFAPLHRGARPDRVLDLYRLQIAEVFLAPDAAPPKHSDDFDKWLEAVWWPRFGRFIRYTGNRFVFTDGSYKHDPDVRSGSGWLVMDGPTHVAHGKLGGGRATSFDAEMLGLARGVNEALRSVPVHITQLTLCADNKAALRQIIRPQVGPSQMAAISVCKALRAFLAGHPARRVVLL